MLCCLHSWKKRNNLFSFKSEPRGGLPFLSIHPSPMAGEPVMIEVETWVIFWRNLSVLWLFVHNINNRVQKRWCGPFWLNFWAEDTAWLQWEGQRPETCNLKSCIFLYKKRLFWQMILNVLYLQMSIKNSICNRLDSYFSFIRIRGWDTRVLAYSRCCSG